MAKQHKKRRQAEVPSQLGDEPPVLSKEDHAILDDIWDEIGKEREADRAAGRDPYKPKPNPEK